MYSAEPNRLSNFGRGHMNGTCTMRDYFEYWLDVHEQMAFKDFSFFSSGGNLGKGLYKENLCQMILNLGQLFKGRCCLKVFFLFKALVTRKKRFV